VKRQLTRLLQQPLKDDFDRRYTFQGPEYDIPLFLTMDVEGEMKGGVFACFAAV
jgi:hypothetical protein